MTMDEKQLERGAAERPGEAAGGGGGRRKGRSDGEKSRQAILQAAAKLATTRGFGGLSIGDLAAHIGMSKSGLYAHFESKEELELATIEYATEVFEADVMGPAREAPPGVARLLKVVEMFLSHLERRVYPGGCFFAAIAAELAAQPGKTRDRIMEMTGSWGEFLVRCVEEGQEAGEVQKTADARQVGYEVHSMMTLANLMWTMTGKAEVLERAREGVKHVLERVRTPRSRAGFGG